MAGGGWCLPSPCGASRCHQNLYFADGKKGNFVCLDIRPLCALQVSAKRAGDTDFKQTALEDISVLLGGHLKSFSSRCGTQMHFYFKFLKKIRKAGITKGLKDWEKTHYCVFEVAENIDIHDF